MDKKFNLIISVSLAVCIYVLLVLGILFYLKPQKDNESKKVSMEETIIEVSIDASSNENIVEPSKNIEDIKPQELITKQEISKSISNKSEPDVKSLFSNIKSDAPGQISKEKPSSSSNTPIAKFQSKIEREKNIKDFELSKLADIKSSPEKTQSVSSPQSQGIFDAYYSKVTSIILTRWYHVPLSQDAKYLVSANITIDSTGNFSFVMVKYSGNSRIDDAVKSFLRNQSLLAYPVSPDKLTKTIRINFIPSSD